MFSIIHVNKHSVQHMKSQQSIAAHVLRVTTHLKLVWPNSSVRLLPTALIIVKLQQWYSPCQEFCESDLALLPIAMSSAVRSDRGCLLHLLGLTIIGTFYAMTVVGGVRLQLTKRHNNDIRFCA